MSIITLTSDMGTRDYYVAAVKGYILGEIPDVNIVDITHDISPFNIVQAAFVVSSAYKDFPEGTIHIISVDPEEVPSPDPETAVTHVAIRYDNHFFIGADNGMFSLIFKREPEEIVELAMSQNSDDLSFPTKHIFAQAACHLARGGTLSVIGRPKESLFKVLMYQPAIEENALVGIVMYIDSYGNMITNITREIFEHAGKGRAFELKIRGADYGITKISQTYREVQEGNALAIFTSNDHLEIAINKGVEGKGGGAASLFGVTLNDSVRVEFEETPKTLSDF